MIPKATRLVSFVLSLSAPLFLVACGSDGPDIEAGFAAEVKEGWQLESFKVTASEESGSKVSPVSQHRFVAEVAPREDLYQKVATLHGKDVLKRIFAKGSESEVHGVGVAAFSAGKWETHYQIEESPFFKGGQPAKAFAANHVVVGSSEFRSLIQSAKADLEKLQKQSDQLTTDIQQKTGQLQTATVEGQTKINMSSEMVARVQQDTRNKQNAEYQSNSQKVQEIKTRWAGEINGKRTAFLGTYNEQKKELDDQYGADIKAIRAERTEAGKWRQTERSRVLAEYNAALADARKQKLDAAGLAAVKASATEKSKAEYAAIEEQTSSKVEDTKKREAEVTAGYRERLSALQGENQAAVKTMTDELSAKRDGELEVEKQKYDATIAAANAELKAAQDAHNQTVTSNREGIRQMSTEISNMRGQLNNNSQNMQSIKEVLGFLEKQGD